MNIKDSNLYKIIAAAAIGLILLIITAIISGGKQGGLNNNYGGTDGIPPEGADESGGDTDSEKDGTADNIDKETENDSAEPEQSTDAPDLPDYISYITGEACSEDEFNSSYYAYVTDPAAPLYGISYSDLTIEFPLELGDTRLVVYSLGALKLGKIGSIAPTREYISHLSSYFGGVIVSYGNDGIVDLPYAESSAMLDLKENVNYMYKENGKNVYTDINLIQDALLFCNVDKEGENSIILPYDFCDFGDEIVGKNSAFSVLIPYSENRTTILNYNASDKKYIFSKDGRYKIDLLTGEAAAYTNVFVLFSDALTYEMSSGIEMVIDITSGGAGYYASHGSLIEIRWRVDENNFLVFETLSGERLVINRGNSYIGYYKASDKDAVLFE